MAGSKAREDDLSRSVTPKVARSTGRPALVVMALSLVVLAGAMLWLIITAATGGRRAAAQGRPVRLLTQERPFPPHGRFAGDPYAGPRACFECHPAEAALYSRSGHATTLRAASRLELSRQLHGTQVVDPEFGDVSWHYAFRDGRLHIERKAPDRVDEFIAEYAFGSGRHATTFVNMIDPDLPAIFEHRLTHYTKSNEMAITPGHDAHPPPPGLTVFGGALPARASQGCFACHVTVLSARENDQRIDEQLMIPNVSCERCHGPGRAHVSAARRRAAESELALPFGPDRWQSDALLKLCGSCHRHPSGAPAGKVRADDPQMARYQPVGLSQSRCFKESNGALSCVSCHDPHARASTNRAAYDLVCLSCHRGGANDHRVSRESLDTDKRSQATARRFCPVSPGARCVECHMPKVDAGQHVLFSDHWIRVRAR